MVRAGRGQRLSTRVKSYLPSDGSVRSQATPTSTVLRFILASCGHTGSMYARLDEAVFGLAAKDQEGLAIDDQLRGGAAFLEVGDGRVGPGGGRGQRERGDCREGAGDVESHGGLFLTGRQPVEHGPALYMRLTTRKRVSCPARFSGTVTPPATFVTPSTGCMVPVFGSQIETSPVLASVTERGCGTFDSLKKK